MGFVKYIKTGSRVGKPKISIWTRGQIGFNQGAIVKYKIDSYKYAVIFFDQDTNRIGITLTNDDNEEGISKLVFRKAGGVSFSAMSFLKAYDVDYSKTKQYEFEYDEVNDMYIINLNQSS